MKGCYCLIIKLDSPKTVRVGKLGKIRFQKGFYVYVGSAMNSLEARLNRHLSDAKKTHWHIDYLLKSAEIVCIIYNENRKVECEMSHYLSEIGEGIEGFGCSDCRCESHLYFFESENEAVEHVKGAYDSMAVDYDFY